MGRVGLAPRTVLWAALAVAALGLSDQRARAQAPAGDGRPVPGVTVGAVLTIDPERLFSDTQFGQRVQADLEARAAELSAENRRIETELVAEERDLTERRAGMPVNEFRELADAFDEKVQRIREEQDAKSREVLRLSDTGRQNFLSQVAPVLSQLLLERGGSVMIDRRNVFLSLDLADVTDAAIQRINEVLGDGSDLPAPQ